MWDNHRYGRTEFGPKNNESAWIQTFLEWQIRIFEIEIVIQHEIQEIILKNE